MYEFGMLIASTNEEMELAEGRLYVLKEEVVQLSVVTRQD
jgi:hypothetical protein